MFLYMYAAVVNQTCNNCDAIFSYRTCVGGSINRTLTVYKALRKIFIKREYAFGMSSDSSIPSAPTGMSGQLQVPETAGKMEAPSQASTTPRDHWEIVTLNVGGRR